MDKEQIRAANIAEAEQNAYAREAHIKLTDLCDGLDPLQDIYGLIGHLDCRITELEKQVIELKEAKVIFKNRHWQPIDVVVKKERRKHDNL